MRRTIFVTAVLVLALAGSARAQDTPITASLTPNAPAAGSTLHVGVDGAAPELAGALPESLVARPAARLRARPRRGPLALRRQPCVDRRLPARRAGSAAARRWRARAGCINADIPATIAIFLADRVQAGDLASVVLRVDAAARRAPCAPG